MCSAENFLQTAVLAVEAFFQTNARALTLSLLMLGIFGTNNHNFAVALDNLALVAHGFN